MTSIDVSVVVPTYRGADSVAALLEGLHDALDPMGLEFELLLVNDASPDGTWAVVEKLAACDRRVRGIDLLRNHGQPVATMCGLANSRGRVVVTMDDDLQHPPDQLPLLLRELDERPELDAIVGSWQRDEGLFRNFGSWANGFADRMAHGTPKGFRHTAFRAIRRPVVDAMVSHQTRLPVIGPLLTQVTTRVANIAVRHDARAAGESGFRFLDGVRRVTSNFVQGSTLPLRLMSWFGLFVATLAFLASGFFLLRGLFGNTAPGWLSVFLATVFFGGMILVQIGLVSQYIHVIVKEVASAPRWTVRCATDERPADPNDTIGGEGL